MGAPAVGPWVGEQKPLGKSPLRGNPSPESTYLPTYQMFIRLGLAHPAPAKPDYTHAPWGRKDVHTISVVNHRLLVVVVEQPASTL